MAAATKPQKVSANLKDTWWFATACEDMTAPTDAEINALTGLNFTCFLLAEQDGVTGTTNKAQLARLLCESGTTEVLDNVVWSMSDIVSLFDPQGAAGSDGKKTWEAFGASGASGFLFRRQGKTNNTDADVTAGDFVDVLKVDIAPGTPGKTATDASGLYAFTCGVALVDKQFNVAVVASGT